MARGLRERLVGRRFTGVHIRWPRTVAAPEPERLAQELVGRQVQSVGRRGKYVVLGLDRGCLLIHLKMSGRLLVVSASDPIDAHTHTLFDLDDGFQLRFRDVRKFGRVYLIEEMDQITGSLGPEPLADDLTLEAFSALLARRSGRLKALLLNQTFLAGLGNIYADESLYAAGLHPLRAANSLTADEQSRLYHAIRRVLGRAVDGRGTTLEDQGYVDAAGQPGSYQDRIAVYGRTGKPCGACGATIERIIVGGRSAHYCPRCQS